MKAKSLKHFRGGGGMASHPLLCNCRVSSKGDLLFLGVSISAAS